MSILLSYGHVEASLLDFVLDITTTFLALVTQHLRKNPLEGIIAHRTFNGMIAVVADIKSGSKEVARTLRGILVMTLQLGDIFLAIGIAQERTGCREQSEVAGHEGKGNIVDDGVSRQIILITEIQDGVIGDQRANADR